SRAGLRHLAPRLRPLPPHLSRADAADAALHGPRRGDAHHSPRYPTFRERHEQRAHRDDPPGRSPSRVPSPHAGVRPVLRRAARVHLHDPRPCLHRLRHGGGRQARYREKRRRCMNDMSLVAIVSIFTAGITTAIGSAAAALGEGRAAAQALQSIAQQPDEANTISRTMFIGLAMVETSGIYCFVIGLILIFANPFWAGI